MIIKVLGSSAGGSFPQWNCDCKNCNGCRNNLAHLKKRTQSSIAISEDGKDWLVCNTSPDILEQIYNSPFLHPTNGRQSPIKGILLVDGQIDHTTGLFMLREGCPHDVYCTKEVKEELSTSYPIFNILKHWNGGINHHEIGFDREFNMPFMPKYTFHAIWVTSNAPPYSPYRDKPRKGDNIGIAVVNNDTGKKFVYLPCFGLKEEHVLKHMREADILLIDGTVWTNNEMIDNKFSKKTGIDMGHMPLSDEGGTIDILDTMDKPRKILIHINNTNPILDETSKEHNILKEHNIEISYDGMSLEL